MRAFCVFVLLVGSLAAVVFAQQKDAQVPPVFRTRVDVVVLDVSVLDADRRPVRGLIAGDFTVLEDGRPQKVTMFTAVDVPDPEPPTAPWVREAVTDVRSNEDDERSQIFVIVVDDANPMSAADAMSARKYAKSVIDRLGPRDLAAVVFVANAGAGQEFTHDRARLLAAVDRFVGTIPGGVERGGALEFIGPVMALRTLKGQAEALADLPAARKAVIYISVRGAAVPDDLVGEGDAAGQQPAEGMDAGGMQSQNFGEFGEMVRAAQRANLNIYCMDPGGLRAPETRPTPSGNQTTVMIHNPNVTGIASLQAISVNTGGFAIVGTNDPEPGITRVFQENRSYYLLAYASSNPRVEGRYRKVSVRVNRPGVTVRTRNGYFEPDRKEMRRAAAVASTTDSALAAPVARSDVPMQLTAAPFAVTGKQQAAVAVTLAIRHTAPEAVARFANLSVTINASDYTAKRRATDRFNVRVAFRPGPADETTFEIPTRVELAPGRYQLRVAAAVTPEWNTGPVASVGRTRTTGTLLYDLDVPDFARERLSLSGIVVNVREGLRSAGSARLKSLVPFAPTTLRQFIANDNVQAFLRVYQGGKQPPAAVSVTSRIFDPRNQIVAEKTETLAPAAFGSARSADYFLPLPLRDLQPGPHLLTVEAKLGEKTARREVRFAVR